MPDPFSAPLFKLTISGVPIPILQFETTIGAYGSIGSLKVLTTRTTLQAQGFPLVANSLKAEKPLPVELVAGYAVETIKQIFSGLYDDSEWDFHLDVVHVNARDLASELADTKMVITAPGFSNAPGFSIPNPDAPARPTPGINYGNKTVDQLVTEIAVRYGFKPVVTAAPKGAGGKPVTVGAALGPQGSYMVHPLPVWSILQGLAKSVGYLCYVTPGRELVFAPPPPDDIEPTDVSWNIKPPPSALPLKSLRITHSPRRNSSFYVLVLSHHGPQAITTVGQVLVLGETLELLKVQKIPEGIYAGAAAGATRKPSNRLLQGKPVYIFRVEGLTPDQAQQRAEGIARDIAKREIIVRATLEGTTDVNPLQPIRLTGDVGQFAGRVLYINSVHQRFHMPSPDHPASGNEGWWTDITALSLPPQSISDPNSVVKPQ